MLQPKPSSARGASFERAADLRYAGQSFELTVPAENPDEMTAAFHAAHERRFGYRMDEEPVETVSVRLTATIPVALPDIGEFSKAEGIGGTRAVNFDGEWTQTPVLQRTMMGAGTKIDGPCIVEFSEATAVIRPGWSGVIDDVGTLVMRR